MSASSLVDRTPHGSSAKRSQLRTTLSDGRIVEGKLQVSWDKPSLVFGSRGDCESLEYAFSEAAN